MDQKTIAWVSYITLIGWIVALVSYNGSTDKSSLAKFHLRQSFGIMATGFALGIVVWILSIMILFIVPFLIFFISILWFIVWAGIIVLWIMGLVGATSGQEKPVPVLGGFYQKTFTFIN